MSNPNQLFLLADHIKLSLLERQRAASLQLGDAGDDSNNGDGHISRSLDQFRDGVAALEERTAAGDGNDASLADALPSLKKQLEDLTSQFHGFSSPRAAATLTSPNDASLAGDFAHATSKTPKTVRFSDTAGPPSSKADNAAEDDLFSRYRDDPDPESHGYRDRAEQLQTNAQVHAYHSQVLEEQDEQLDRLGESIGRQRELSMRIGDELDEHVEMLDDLEGATDRHQGRLDRAGRALGKVARRANENKQITTIFVLIIILVLLIAILK